MYKFFYIFLLIAWSQVAFAQYATGARRDTAQLRRAEQATLLLRKTEQSSKGVAADVTPKKVDLRPYCPTVGNQQKLPTCVVWATLHSALTTQLAKKHNITNQTRINALAFSVSHIFNQASPSCKAISLSELETVLAKGVSLAAFFPNTLLCATPTVQHAIPIFHLNQFSALLVSSDTDSLDKNLRLMKRELKKGRPIVIQVRSVPSLFKLKHHRWKINHYEKDSLAEDHALSVVGYDDETGCFELMNSWGQDWAEKGFARVRYEDLLANALQPNGILQAAFRVELDLNQTAILDGWTMPLLQRLVVPQSPFTDCSYETIFPDKETTTHFSQQSKIRLLLPVCDRTAHIYVFGRDAGSKQWEVYSETDVKRNELGIVLPNSEDLLSFSAVGEEIIGCAISQEKMNVDRLAKQLNKLPQKVNHALHQNLQKIFEEGRVTTFVLKIQE